MNSLCSNLLATTWLRAEQNSADVARSLKRRDRRRCVPGTVVPPAVNLLKLFRSSKGDALIDKLRQVLSSARVSKESCPTVDNVVTLCVSEVDPNDMHCAKLLISSLLSLYKSIELLDIGENDGIISEISDAFENHFNVVQDTTFSVETATVRELLARPTALKQMEQSRKDNADFKSLISRSTSAQKVRCKAAQHAMALRPIRKICPYFNRNFCRKKYILGKGVPNGIYQAYNCLQSRLQKDGVDNNIMHQKVADLLTDSDSDDGNKVDAISPPIAKRFSRQSSKGRSSMAWKWNKLDEEENMARTHKVALKYSCDLIHFKRKEGRTGVAVDDCSFYNNCYNQSVCRYTHYYVEAPANESTITQIDRCAEERVRREYNRYLAPPQWIQCGITELDLSIFGEGRFDVIMADPPWKIHIDVPYNTIADDVMKQLPLKRLQKPGGLLFLWVTQRAVEVGLQCIKEWGYVRVDELVWIKINQLQGITRTGKTGHWLNHAKEHCLVAVRVDENDAEGGACLHLPVKNLLDSDVLVSEVRETSRKPDKIYDIIDRICGHFFEYSRDDEAGGSTNKAKIRPARKLELFGRIHNTRRDWITIGDQLPGTQLAEKTLIESFIKLHPNGCGFGVPVQTHEEK